MNFEGGIIQLIIIIKVLLLSYYHSPRVEASWGQGLCLTSFVSPTLSIPGTRQVLSECWLKNEGTNQSWQNLLSTD